MLPELKHLRTQLLDQERQQQQQQEQLVDDDASSTDDDTGSSSGGCSTAGMDPQLLVGYAAYLLHHQHLAARDPRVRQEWAHALLWVCAPPEAAARGTATCSTSRGAGGERALGASGPSDASLASKDGEGERDVEHGQEEGEHSGSRQPPKGWAVLPCNDMPSGTTSSSSSSSSSGGATYSGGVCLGLSFPALYTARHPAEAPTALAALAAALRGVPSALWVEGYGRYGSAVQWAEFCGPALLGCGFSFVRVCRRQVLQMQGQGQAAAGEGLQQGGVRGEGHGGLGEAVEDWVSSDLEAVLKHVLRPQGLPKGEQEQEREEEEDTGLHAAAPQQGANGRGVSDGAGSGGDGHGLAPQGVLDAVAVDRLTAIAQLLDATWAEEYGRYAFVRRLQPTAPSSSAATAAATVAPAASAGKAHATVAGPSSFLQLLRSATWLPDSWGGVAAPGSGALLLPTRAVRGVLGPAARYVSARLSDPRFGVALGLVAKPTVECVLGQLVEWQQAAGRCLDGGQQQVQLQQQPGMGDLAACYGYLWAEVCREQEQQEQEEAEGAEDGGEQRGGAQGGRVAAAVAQAFAAAPLVCLPAAAAAAGPGRGGTAPGPLRWCTAEETVWSLGPLEAVVAEGRGAAGAAAAAAAVLLPARLSDAYPASLE